MSNIPTNKMKNRLFFVVFLAFLLVAAYICVVLFDVAVVKSDYYKAKANNQQITSFTINANRGSIYDTNGKILAHSLTVWDVIIAPNTIASNADNYQQQRAAKAQRDYNTAIENGERAIKPTGKEVYDEADEICRALSEILDVDYEKLRKTCEDTSIGYHIVQKKVSKPLADEINEFKKEMLIGANCLTTYENTLRTYPNDALAANIIGFTNYDNEGVYGIEAYYDDYLQGVNGKIEIATDVNGSAMPYDRKANYAAQDGNSLYLTIDEVLQHYLEKNLETTVSQHKVKNRATGIMMDPNTGAVLAMATYPSYNLNEPSVLSDVDLEIINEQRRQMIIDALVAAGFPFGVESDLPQSKIDEIDNEIAQLKTVARETQWKNKAVNELYFPGSVFKTVTAASYIEEQLDQVQNSFYCSGVEMVAGTEIDCHARSTLGGHGQVSLQDALTKSCNPAFIQIGAALGSDRFSKYFEAFGFTKKTGIDLPGESRSLYIERDRMGPVELASCSFGQSNKVTPLQMVTALAAIVNGGYLVTPYVVDKVVDNNGNVIKSAETTVKRQVVSNETSAVMRQMLETVVESNGGVNAYISGYRIGGKSGTTERIDEWNKIGYKDESHVATFAAFAPADAPEVVMLVCVDTPTNGAIYGSAVAAPVVSAVFKEALPYMEIYPQYSDDEQANLDVAVPYLIGKSSVDALSSLNALGVNARFIGDESKGKVLYTVPQAGQKLAKGGKVVVYLEEQDYLMSTVPDVRGYDVENANYLLTQAGLNMSFSGTDTAGAVATIQSVEAGTQVASGTVVEVLFIVNDQTG